MNQYELVALLHPDLEIDLDKPLAKIEKIVKDLGGKITKTDNWGKRKLAYAIKKQDFAIYVYYEFELDTDKVAKLDSTLNITDEVIRHLVSRYVEAPEEEDEEEDKQTENDNNKEEE